MTAVLCFETITVNQRIFLSLTLGYEFLLNQTTWVDVTIEGVTTTSPSIASSTTAQTALSESSQEPTEIIFSQTTTDDSVSQEPIDSSFMFSTSMAPSGSSDSPSSQDVTAITEDLKVDDSVTTLARIRNVSETQHYGVHLVSTTAVPAVSKPSSIKSEDSKAIEIGTIPPDVLISAPPSTEPMFALGITKKTEKIDIASDLMHTTPDLTVEPTKSISMSVEVLQSSTTKDDLNLPNIINVHLTTITEISPTESAEFGDYDSSGKDTEIGVMAGPPPTQTITGVSDTTKELSTMPDTTDATVKFATYTTQPSAIHSDVSTSASFTDTIQLTTSVLGKIPAEASDLIMSSEETLISCTPEVLGEGVKKGEDTENIPLVSLSAEKSTKNCTVHPSVQVIIINIHQQNETGKALLIFLTVSCNI